MSRNGHGELQCQMCKHWKHEDEFYVSSNPNHREGRNIYCKHCCKVNRAMESVRKRDRSSKVSRRQEYRANALPGVEVESGLTLAMVFKKDLGICYLCETWVQPKHASMDHQVALSRGGHHVMSNLRLTHLKCNLRKGHRDVEDF